MAKTLQIMRVPGSEAISELNRLRSDFKRAGLYPILFGDDEEYSRIQEAMQYSSNDFKMTGANRATDPVKWFADKKEDEPELYEDEIGEWPSTPSERSGITSHLELSSRRPKHEVVIGLLEIAQPSEAFIHLNWGGWNDCPHPAEHAAIHQYWQANWGAEVVCIGGDVVECVVARPPRDREAALRLSMEQYVYCYDIVAQGTQTISALAAELLNSPTWFFWWD